MGRFPQKSPIIRGSVVENDADYVRYEMATLTGWRGPIGCLICIGCFPQKRPIIRGSVAESDLQLTL